MSSPFQFAAPQVGTPIRMDFTQHTPTSLIPPRVARPTTIKEFFEYLYAQDAKEKATTNSIFWDSIRDAALEDGWGGADSLYEVTPAKWESYGIIKEGSMKRVQKLAHECKR